MFDKAFTSFKDNLIQRATNPFLGTFMIVWIIQNWRFVYSLFYFEATVSLDIRLSKIAEFFSTYSIYNFIATVSITFLVLILTYILLNVSRAIVNFFDKVVTPLIYKLTDDTSIVMRKDYNELEDQIQYLEKKVQEERESRLKVQADNETLEVRISELLADNSEGTSTKKPAPIQLDELSHDEATKALLIFEKLKKDNRINEYNDVATNILNKTPIDGNLEYIRDYSSLRLIVRATELTGGLFYFKMTKMGEQVHDKIIIDKFNVTN